MPKKKSNQKSAVKNVHLRDEIHFDRLKEITTQMSGKKIDRVMEEIKAMNIAMDLENIKLIAGWLLNLSMVNAGARFFAEVAVEVHNRLIPPYNALLRLQFKEFFKKFICPQRESVLEFKVNQLIPLIKELYNLDFFDKNDIFEMMEYLGTSVFHEDLNNILQFTENFHDFFLPRKLLIKNRERVESFAQTLTFKTANSSIIDKNVVTNILRELQLFVRNNEQTNYDFDELVLKIKSGEDLEEVFDFKSPENEAENFLQSSIKLGLNKEKFADFVTKITKSSSGLEFKDKLLMKLDSLFKKQHLVETRKRFKEREVITTTEFITELFARELMQVEQVKGFLLFTGDQGIVPTTSKCNLLLNKALHAAKNKNQDSKSKIRTIPNTYPFMNNPNSTTIRKLMPDEEQSKKYKLALERWIDEVNAAGVENIEKLPELKCIFAHSYEMKTLAKQLEEQIASGYCNLIRIQDPKLFRKDLEICFRVLAIEMLEESLISTSSLIRIWNKIGNELQNGGLALQLLTLFVCKTREFVTVIEGDKSRIILENLRDKLMDCIPASRQINLTDSLSETLIAIDEILCPPKVPEPEKSALEEFEILLKSNEIIENEKLEGILMKICSSEKDLKKVARVFTDSARERKEIAQLALLIDNILKTSKDFSFKESLVNCTQNALKKLHKFDEIKESGEIGKVENLVRLTGELYNVNWMNQPQLISCMDKLSFKNFATVHQVEMFESLLKIVKTEMICRNHVGKCKNFIEMLTSTISESTNESSDIYFTRRQFNCIQICEEIVDEAKKSHDFDLGLKNLKRNEVVENCRETFVNISYESIKKSTANLSNTISILEQSFDQTRKVCLEIFQELSSSLEEITPENLKNSLKSAEKFLDSENNCQNSDSISDLSKEYDNIKNFKCVIDNFLKSSEICFDDNMKKFVNQIIKNLPKFDKLSKNPEELERANNLVLLTGELYKAQWIDFSQLTSCMDKLSLKNFVTFYQVLMFESLLKAVKTEMIERKHVGNCKRYIVMLKLKNVELMKVSATNNIFKDKVEICVRICEQIIKGKNDEEMYTKLPLIQNKIMIGTIEDFNNMFKDLSLKNLKEVAEKFKKQISPETLTILMAKAYESPSIVVKLSQEINSTSFGELLQKCCHKKLLNYKNAVENNPENKKLPHLVHFIGELYNKGLANENLVTFCLETLFNATNEGTIECIMILVSVIGEKMEINCKEILDRYFKYFNFIVSHEETSPNIAKTYSYLIEMQKNEWKNSEKISSSLLELCMEKLNSENIALISRIILRLIANCDATAANFIRKVFEIVTFKTNYSKICAELLQIMNKISLESSFSRLLQDFLKVRNVVFSAVSEENFSEIIKVRLGRFVIFVAELFKLEVISQESAETWLEDKIIINLTLEDAVFLSCVVGEKVNEVRSNEHVKLKIQLEVLDRKIENRMENLKLISLNDIKELKK